LRPWTVCRLGLLCKRLVSFRQFEQARTGLLIGDASGKGAIASGAGQQIGSIHRLPNDDAPGHS
jgi:hypothetical protein